MALVRETLIEDFIENLTGISVQRDGLGVAHLLNVNTVMETFCMHLLNMMYGWNLKNANTIKMNFPGIDLIDEANKIVVQVSSEYTSSKINNTLSNRIMEKLAKDDYNLKFCFIGENNRKHKKFKNCINTFEISYDPSKDDITFNDLIRDYSMIEDLDQQKAILEYIEKETGKKFKLTEKISENNIQLSTKLLGSRYTPQANIETPIISSLNGFVQSSSFIKDLKELTEESKSLIRSYQDNIYDDVQYPKALSVAVHIAENIIECFNSEDFRKLKLAYEQLYELRENYYSIKGNHNINIAPINSFFTTLNKFFNTYEYEIFNKQVLIISGKAGMGKSHSLADFMNSLDNEKYFPFFFLGHKFMKNDPPLDQMISQLDKCCDCTSKEFLDELDDYKRLTGKQIVIAIDAINEGKGKVYWKNALFELIELVKEHGIKLILTVRSDYENIILNSNDILSDSRVCKIEHDGFKGIEYEAIDSYCQYYGLHKPFFPFIEKVYRMPLTLKLTCEALSKNGIKEFPKNFTYEFVFDSYVKSINFTLANEMDYNKTLNLVEKALMAIASHDQFEYNSLSYENAQIAVIESLKRFVDDSISTRFLDKLIEVNLLNYSYDKNDYLIFAYEIIGDYFQAKAIMQGFEGIKYTDYLTNSPKLKNMLADSSSLRMNYGCLSMLTALLPNKYNVELYSLCDEMDDEYLSFIGQMFMETLLWRKKIVFPNHKDFIKSALAVDSDLWRDFIKSLNRLGIIEENNSCLNELNNILLKLPLAPYEYIWTQDLAFDKELIHVINWVWDNADKIKKSNLLNNSIQMAWMTASTKSSIRDHATKALTNLLIQKPSTASDLLKNFENCKDDYVLERVYAAIYGAYCHTKTDECWKDICNQVYSLVFKGEETYPNLYVRKYAKLMLESQLIMTTSNSNDLYPLMNSTKTKWFEKIPSNEDIDSLLKSISTKYGSKSREYYLARKIVRSMTTEYGRGVGAYGDFGRYVFQGYVKLFENQINEQSISNIITYDILVNKFDFKLLTNFDSSYVNASYHDEKIERISKKYQWIGMHRILGRLLDNFQPTIIETLYSDTEKETTKIIGFDQEELTIESRKKIGEQEKPVENAEFDIYQQLIDIDPTFIWNSPYVLEKREIVNILTAEAYESIDDFNQIIEEYRIIAIDGKKYINVYSSLEQKRNSKSEKSDSILWYASGCLVKKSEFSDFSSKRMLINSNGIPYESYTGLYFYSFHDDFLYDYISEQYLACENDRYPKYMNLIDEYSWGTDRDSSLPKNESVKIPLLSKAAVNYLDLKRVDGNKWLDENGNLQAFANEINGCKSVYIELDSLKRILHANDCILVSGEFIAIESGDDRYHTWQMSVFNTDDESFSLLIDKD